MRRLLAAFSIGLALSGCGATERFCETGPMVIETPSAGCLLLRGDKLLVVDVRGQGASVPGGSALPGETAACTAQRETYEETGLWLQTGEVLEVFDTGFYLLQCFAPDPQQEPDAGYDWEISEAYWLPRSEFDTTQWRFPGQGEDMARLVDRLLAKSGEAKSSAPGLTKP